MPAFAAKVQACERQHLDIVVALTAEGVGTTCTVWCSQGCLEKLTAVADMAKEEEGMLKHKQALLR
jgi:hypothetical protein